MAVKGAFRGLRRLIKGSGIPEGDKKAVVIAIAAQKGGVGKTTTAVHIAAGLAMFHASKVLLIDMDAQGHVGMSLSNELQSEPPKESFGSLLLQKKRDVQEIVQSTSIENLYVVPSDRFLNETEAQMSSRIGKELILKHALRIARTHYDVIIIDCPPNLGTLTVNALVAADKVLVPCDMSVLSLDGVEALLDALDTVQEGLNPDLRLFGLIRTRVDGRNTTMNRAIEEELLKRYKTFLLETPVGVSTAITKAQLAGKPIFYYDKRNRAAKNYKSLAAEIHSKLRV